MGNFIDRYLGWIAGIMVALMFVGLFFSATEMTEHNKRLMAECMADGHKEYECAGLLRSGKRTVVPVPMPVPMR